MNIKPMTTLNDIIFTVNSCEFYNIDTLITEADILNVANLLDYGVNELCDELYLKYNIQNVESVYFENKQNNTVIKLFRFKRV